MQWSQTAVFPLLALASFSKTHTDSVVSTRYNAVSQQQTIHNMHRLSPGLSVTISSFEHILDWRLKSPRLVQMSDFRFSHMQVDKTKTICHISMSLDSTCGGLYAHEGI